MNQKGLSSHKKRIELLEKYIYDDNFYNDYVVPNINTEKQFETTLGRYKIIYYACTSPIFGISINNKIKTKLFVKNQKILIYEDDVIIHEFERVRQIEEHIILGGDGKSRETTFYVCFNHDNNNNNNNFNDYHDYNKINNNSKYLIYNMNNKQVMMESLFHYNINNKKTYMCLLYLDQNIGMIDINEKYFMYITGEIGSFDLFIYIIEKKKFFDIMCNPYDCGMSNIPDMNEKGNHIPIEATNDGFILKKLNYITENNYTDDYYDDWTGFVKYEDINNYDFYNE